MDLQKPQLALRVRLPQRRILNVDRNIARTGRHPRRRESSGAALRGGAAATIERGRRLASAGDGQGTGRGCRRAGSPQRRHGSAREERRSAREERRSPRAGDTAEQRAGGGAWSLRRPCAAAAASASPVARCCFLPPFRGRRAAPVTASRPVNYCRPPLPRQDRLPSPAGPRRTSSPLGLSLPSSTNTIPCSLPSFMVLTVLHLTYCHDTTGLFALEGLGWNPKAHAILHPVNPCQSGNILSPLPM